MKLGIIFGGISTEHDVSVVSASSIIKNLNKNKYTIYPIYISKDNIWYKVNEEINEVYELGIYPKDLEVIDNIFSYLKEFDIVFPVLHGLYGEDGTIQGLLKMLNIPCVGCGVLSSSICMDKVYTKKILRKANINVTPEIYIQYKDNDKYYIDEFFNEEEISLRGIDKKIQDTFSYPVFVKPSNSGSSVGVTKATNIDELGNSIKNASEYDKKILIEKAINGKEVECAILNGSSSSVGEILSAEHFYTFDAKYNNSASKTVIPANLSEETIEEIRGIAEKAFKAVDGNGLSRIDFFVEHDTNNIYLNEINTLPGFTEISMYPKLIEHMGLTYSEILDELIKTAK